MSGLTWLETAGGVWIPGPTTTYANAVFLTTQGPIYEICGVRNPGGLPPAAAWQTIDLSPLFAAITSSVLAVDVGGFLIISDGATTDISDLAIAFQQSGSGANPLDYTSQTIAVGPSGGSRTTFGGWAIPVIATSAGANCIDFAWLRGDPGHPGEWPSGPLTPYPNGAAYEVTVCIQRVYAAS